MLSPEDIPLCPLCDLPIMSYELSEVYTEHNAKCLVHLECLEEHQDDNT